MSLPRLPDADDREPPPTAQSRDAATLLALMAIGGIVLAILLVMTMVLPGMIYILGVVLVFGLYFVFHYVVWGRWLANRLRDESPADNPPDTAQWRQP